MRDISDSSRNRRRLVRGLVVVALVVVAILVLPDMWRGFHDGWVAAGT